MFVNFIVEKFLVDEKDRVRSLLSTLENNSVSDEKVTIMEASIEAFSYRILQSPDLTGKIFSSSLGFPPLPPSLSNTKYTCMKYISNVVFCRT